MIGEGLAWAIYDENDEMFAKGVVHDHQISRV